MLIIATHLELLGYIFNEQNLKNCFDASITQRLIRLQLNLNSKELKKFFSKVLKFGLKWERKLQILNNMLPL